MPRKTKQDEQEVQETKKEKTPETSKENKEKASAKKEEYKKSAKKKISQAEFEKMVIKLADEGLTSEKIGENLRKQGIHPARFKKKISVILKDAGKYENPDLKNIEEKLEKIKKHYEKNKNDKRAMREKDRVFSQLRKTKKYFKVAIK